MHWRYSGCIGELGWTIGSVGVDNVLHSPVFMGWYGRREERVMELMVEVSPLARSRWRKMFGRSNFAGGAAKQRLVRQKKTKFRCIIGELQGPQVVGRNDSLCSSVWASTKLC